MPAKVLIVDDTRTIREHLQLILERQGYAIATARDGAEALVAIRRDPPDLVLMDIMMPNMDGIQCCRAIKSAQDTRDIKVVMITSKGDRAKVSDAFSAGCSGYITKPIDQEGLLRKVSEMLKFSESRRKLSALVRDRSGHGR